MLPRKGLQVQSGVVERQAQDMTSQDPHLRRPRCRRNWAGATCPRAALRWGIGKRSFEPRAKIAKDNSDEMGPSDRGVTTSTAFQELAAQMIERLRYVWVSGKTNTNRETQGCLLGRSATSLPDRMVICKLLAQPLPDDCVAFFLFCTNMF